MVKGRFQLELYFPVSISVRLSVIALHITQACCKPSAIRVQHAFINRPAASLAPLAPIFMASITKEQATHLDLILQLLHDKTMNVGSVDEINANLLRDKPREYCLSLFYILADYHPRLLYPINNLNDDMFWATDYVPAFLHDGGFMKMYDTAAAKYEAEQEKERLNLEKLRYDVKNSKRIFKTYWWTFAFALISFIYILIQIALKIIEATSTHPGK